MPRIRPYLAGTKKTLALGSFVTRQAFPLREYYATIEELRAAIEARTGRAGDAVDDRDTLLVLLAGVVDRDGEFLAYVLDDTNYDLSSDREEAQWKLACEALAWTILQEYDKACERGDWP
jgi:hypothetical protein